MKRNTLKNLLLGKHRVRANFYHFSALGALIVISLNLIGQLEDRTALYLTLLLFLADYLAEMFDPHPVSPGPWHRRYFHRAFEIKPTNHENSDE